MATTTKPSRPFQLCGRSLLTFVLKPEMPIGQWVAETDSWLATSPGFFVGKPVVMDVSDIRLTKPKMAELIKDMNARDIRVMGIIGVDPSIADPELPPVLSQGRGPGRDVASEIAKPLSAKVSEATPSLLIDSPIRSGQTLFHEGDLTVIGSVSSGAEIVATGSIHIYGTLRGRVLAGADGNPSARIFCRRLQAELIAIDGYYRMADDIAPFLGKSIHASLENGALTVRALD